MRKEWRELYFITTKKKPKNAELQRKRKLIDICTGVLLISTFVFIFFIPSVLAANDNEFQLSMAKQILSGVFGIIQGTLTGTGNYASFYKYMTGVGTGFDTAFATAYVAIKVFGAMWAIGIAMSHVFACIERGQDGIEATFKVLTELCIVCIFLMNLDALMAWIVQFGNFIIGLVSGLVPVNNDAALTTMAEDFLTKLTGQSTGGIIWGIKSILYMIIPWICSLLLEIAAKFLVLQILIEIGVRRAFAPLAVADIYQEGLRSPGVRYLKRYACTFLKMAICLLVCFLGTELMSLTNPNAMSGVSGCLEYVFEVVAIQFTCIGVMFKSGEYANDIMGV